MDPDGFVGRNSKVLGAPEDTDGGGNWTKERADGTPKFPNGEIVFAFVETEADV